MILTSSNQQIILTLNMFSFWLQQSDSEKMYQSICTRAKIWGNKKKKKKKDLDSEFKVYSSIIRVVKYTEKY